MDKDDHRIAFVRPNGEKIILSEESSARFREMLDTLPTEVSR